MWDAESAEGDESAERLFVGALGGLEVYASSQIYTAIGIMFVTDHFRVNAGNVEVGGGIETASGNNYLCVLRFICQRANDRFLGEEIEVYSGV